MIDPKRKEEFNQKARDILDWLVYSLEDFTEEHKGEVGLDVNWEKERKLLKEAERQRQTLIKDYSLEED